ncbi:MAG: adenylate/guanylate cyclase domain-containing protein [Mycobacteriaceae bacterium]
MHRTASRVLPGVHDADPRPEAAVAPVRARRRLPGDPRFAVGLSTAGVQGLEAVARVSGRLLDYQPAASKKAILGARQLWQFLSDRAAEEEPVREVTVVFTDLVSFSEWSLRSGDDNTLALLRLVAAAVEQRFTAHGGRIVKRLGDGVMAVFPTPQQAFDALIAARLNLGDIEVAGYRPKLHTGVHTGHPRPIGSDYLGVDVTIAARLAEHAGADEMLMSQATLDQLDPAHTLADRKQGQRWSQLKGVPSGLGVYAVSPVTE